LFQFAGWILTFTNLRDETMISAASKYKSPVRKVIAFLEKGRNAWKAKYQQVKRQLRRAENQNRVVESSRENWRERALLAEAELRVPKKKAGTHDRNEFAE